MAWQGSVLRLTADRIRIGHQAGAFYITPAWLGDALRRCLQESGIGPDASKLQSDDARRSSSYMSSQLPKSQSLGDASLEVRQRTTAVALDSSLLWVSSDKGDLFRHLALLESQGDAAPTLQP